jgi:hypothetical protein
VRAGGVVGHRARIVSRPIRAGFTTVSLSPRGLFLPHQKRTYGSSGEFKGRTVPYNGRGEQYVGQTGRTSPLELNVDHWRRHVTDRVHAHDVANRRRGSRPGYGGDLLTT